MSSVSSTPIEPQQRQQLRDWPSIYFEAVLGVEPFQYQSDFLDSPNDRKQLCCGRQVGKTEICAGDGLHDATTNDGHDVLIIAPTQRQSSNLFRRIKTMMNDSPIEDWGIERETQTIIEFANDSRIICLPAGTDGSTIRGYTADYIVVDEAAFVPDSVFTSVLNPMLATTDGTMALASTPFGTSGFFYEAYLTDRWESITVETEESPLVNQEFIDEQREELTETEFRQEILGEFVESAGVYLPHSLVKPCVESEPPARTHGSDVFLGVDVAREGSDRTVYTAIDEQGNVFGVKAEDTSTMPSVLGRIINLDRQFGFSGILIDENAVGGGVVDFADEAEEIAHRVLPVSFTLKSKQTMYRGLKKAFEASEIAIPKSDRLLNELTSLRFEYTSTGKLKVSHPPGGHDDYPDSLALAHFGVMKHTPSRQPGDENGIKQF